MGRKGVVFYSNSKIKSSEDNIKLKGKSYFLNSKSLRLFNRTYVTNIDQKILQGKYLNRFFIDDDLPLNVIDL